MFIRFTTSQQYDSHVLLAREVQPITPNLVAVLFNLMVYFLSGSSVFNQFHWNTFRIQCVKDINGLTVYTPLPKRP